MKIRAFLLPVLIGLSAPLLTSCTNSAAKKPSNVAVVGSTKIDGKTVRTGSDLDEYSSDEIADPIEPINRGTFWLNHQLYRYLLRPISKTYETVIPKPVRKGVFNAFENIEFPVRFVNNALQGRFDRAGLETGKFVVNTVGGVGGLIRVSDRIPAMAELPYAETGQTFAKWGIGHGFYFVIPVIGPSSARDTVGLAGDYALNPVTWVAFFWGSWAWTIPVSVTDTVSTMPDKFVKYDAVTANTLDRYLAVRSAWVQARKEAASK